MNTKFLKSRFYILGISFLVTYFLFYDTGGLLGPYGGPNDNYHLIILGMLLFIVANWFYSGATKKR